MPGENRLSPVRCLHCSWDNPAEASYCNGCGMSLSLQPCRRCKATAKRGLPICPNCGAAFLPPEAWSGTRADLAVVVGAVPEVGAASGQAAVLHRASAPAHAPAGALVSHHAGTPRPQVHRAVEPAVLSEPHQEERWAAEPVVVSAPPPEIERDMAFRFALAAVLAACAGIVLYALDRGPARSAEPDAMSFAGTPAEELAPTGTDQIAAEPAQPVPSGRLSMGQAQPQPPTPIVPAALESTLPPPASANLGGAPRAADASRGCSDAVAALGLCEQPQAPTR